MTARPEWPPGVARPALRALAGIGVTRMQQLDGKSRAALAALHGVGPGALAALEAALAERGLALKD